MTTRNDNASGCSPAGIHVDAGEPSSPASAREVTRPKGWTVIGSGPLADGVRAELARDPEAYLPETWSMRPVGRCPCCAENVYRCTTRHTGWRSGFATHSGKVHASFDGSGNPTPDGAIAGCCCVAPNWGPKHGAKKSPRKSRRSR